MGQQLRLDVPAILRCFLQKAAAEVLRKAQLQDMSLNDEAISLTEAISYAALDLLMSW